MIAKVECYSGYRNDERPVRFVIDGRRHEVTSIDRQWRSEDGMHFRVKASDGMSYLLHHDEVRDYWSVEVAE